MFDLFNKKWQLIEKIATVILFMMLVLVNVFSLNAVNKNFGDSRVVNFTGYVRGASQRFVKNEIAGKPSLDLANDITKIITELQTGEGNYNLKVFEDEDFQQSINSLAKSWKKVLYEAEIYRQTGRDNSDLLNTSEEFFLEAHNVVIKAEKLSEENVNNVAKYRMALILLSTMLVFIFAGQFVSISRLKNRNDYLEEKAFIDQMTSLPNRWSCDRELAEYRNIPKLPNVLCISIDLNNLKKLNDMYGHAVGDQLIISSAAILKESAKGYGFMGRNGGDEFLGLFPNFNREKEKEYLEKLEMLVNNHNKHEKIVQVSFSYGSSLSSESPEKSI